MVFAYLEAFDRDPEGILALEAQYRQGGLGDVAIKRRLDETLQELLAPIRARRADFTRDQGEVLAIIRRGSIPRPRSSSLVSSRCGMRFIFTTSRLSETRRRVDRGTGRRAPAGLPIRATDRPELNVFQLSGGRTRRRLGVDRHSCRSGG